MPDYRARLARELFADTATQEAFQEALAAGTAARPALLWMGDDTEELYPLRPPAPWQPPFVQALDNLPPDTLRPGRHPYHDAGRYYCLDLSSVFEASLLPTHAPRILDLCAAPGGKSLFAYRHCHPERLVCNEVIGKRLGALNGNLTRCHVTCARVTRLDASVWASEGKENFDLVLVDAPCSGQSLVARGEDNPGAFHPNVVNQCANRQRRIIANAWQCVAPGGHLAYMTCTYSRAENESVVSWLQKNGEAMAVVAPALEAHRSPLATFPCYRLYPQDGYGAGGFTCLLQKATRGDAHRDTPPADDP